MARQSRNVLTIDEVCAMLKIHRSTLYRLLKAHNFPGYKVGSDWRFNVEQVSQWAVDQERLATGKRCPKT